MDRPLLFGKYCLLERTSVGGMAEVFRAKPLDAPDPNHYFALKRILPHLAEDVEFIKMFVDEARLTVQLRHPNIVHIYELGQFQSSHYIVMEFIAGKDLLAFQKLVRQKGTILDVDMACHIMLEVAKGLDYAHRKTDENGDPLGIIHRDISPQNVLVSWDGRVRVIDFGIAKAASQSTKTKAGVLKGKFGYLSPEQVRAEDIDRRSDVFAMGTLFWELLTNQRLFNAQNQYETLTLIGEPDVDLPSTQNPAVPPEVDEIAMKALQADPDQRYQWASDFAEALERYLMSQKPPYHRSQLTTWLRSAFEEEFEEEKAKREEFREINSADDVRRLFDEEYGEGGEDEDEKSDDATQIWDVDEAPDTGVDLEDFVSNHTMVAAGGLELSDYDDWEDAPDTIDEAEEVVHSRIESEAGEGAVDRMKADHGANYDVPPTMVTNPSAVDSPAAPAVSTPDSPPSNAASAAEPRSQPEAAAATSDALPSPQQASAGPQPSPGETSSQNTAPPSSSVPTQPPPQQRARLNRDETGPTETRDPTRNRRPAQPTPPQGMAAGEDTPSAGGAEQATGPQAVVEAVGVLSSMDDKKLVAAVAAVFAAVALASVAMFTVLTAEDEEELPPVGGVTVDVAPATNLEIYVDGEWRGDRSPLAIDELSPGTYNVEIAHPDYPPWMGDVTVAADAVASLHADLGAEGRLVLSWDDDPEHMNLYVDGESIDADETARRAELSVPRGEYLVEAFGAGVRPIRKQVEVESDRDNEYALSWVADDRLTLTGDADMEVEFDGQALGELPITLSGLELGQLYELQIGDVETVLGFPEQGRETIDADDLDALEVRSEEDYGWLVMEVADEGPWQLVIDDVETGLVAPLADESTAIPLAAGERTVGFQRGDRRYDYRVHIVEEERTLFRPDVPPDG